MSDPAAETFGPCINCGREQTRNPHPHAGEPGHPEAGYVWHCVPCLVENRHRWATRARRAEAALSTFRRHVVNLIDPAQTGVEVKRDVLALIDKEASRA